ncbi:ABC transporter ATP-binding protein [Afifella marina]|uniref:Osmoprotectant transport system ATP-binding protein n=1 Tax=Afifella marina DSM 2698 TaxID=1120955 RepID=A0A1G5M7Q4_AFIMA|nr:ABC transporter ATP-binding protein [Afifella marina]MBK1622866.1 amino acid ABC transporter ATP-binding protein [Afifella marina DSM 2698]MBK1625861.1 amino acid ABC transporter ATP-binding protein [Afifella marina]MBK5917683.1 amino acid ABC transporter ATP-binding protein [Afifella marina]RAI23606.1 amino acid ABC transporter ATP-binding protein [Afifella marina DSM 2698]SCZ21136.1 osmoprotectant transport system ATP-binding protein [Afifella marina DSM 2698]
MIRIEGLTKEYAGNAVVRDVSMEIEAATITVIVGTSGSGKSTFLRMINRLVEPTKGVVEIDGTDTREMKAYELRRRIGYAIQDHGLFPHWTVARNIATVPKLLGWDRKKIDARVHELLELLQLDPDEIAPRYPHQLSGGQAQRVGVARALAARPDMLLMDEPFGALDPVIRAKAQTDLKSIQDRLGSTILLVTHDMAEAIRLGDRIAVMSEGRVEQLAPPAEILTHPASDNVRNLVGDDDRPFRYLSLIPVSERTEEGTAEGTPIAADRSLYDALAEMIWSGREVLPVVGEDGSARGLVRRGALLDAARSVA